jgi:tetratricopeptide (TPR) repeat protein
MRCSRAVFGAFVAALLAATSAAAEPVDEQTRARARTLGEEGLVLYDQGLYIDALDRFERAGDLLKAPTLDLNAARCLAKMGRLVEASERYLDVTRMTVDEKASAVLKAAVVAAAKEREAVLARIATIEIVIEGPGAAGASVRIDGRPVPKAVIGVKTPIDPGIHRIDARGSSGTEAIGRVNLTEKQSVRLVLTLHGAEKSTAAPSSSSSGGGQRAPAPGAVGLNLGGDTAEPRAPTAASKRGGVDEQTRATARTIGEEGLKFYDAGDYFNALDRFERADALIHAPTLGLMAARSLVQLRRLVEASDRYQDVSRSKLDAKASDAFKDAIVTAAKEREVLLPRLPIIDVSVEGPGAADVTELQIDGRTVSPQLLGVRRPISAKLPLDPGDHRLEARLREKHAYERISLTEGGSARVVLRLGTSIDRLETTRAADATAASAQTEPDAWSVSPDAQRQRTAQQVAGWVGLGLGVAGVVTGAVAGGVAIGQRSALDDQCDPNARLCPRSLRDDVGRYNTLRYLSTAGFIAGGVGIAAGTVLLVTAPRASTRPASSGLTLTPFVGVASAGIRGAF